MSASSKKKLRKAQEAEKLTEKQLAEQKEAKKLKIYTGIFAVGMALLVVVAAWIGIKGIGNIIANSGLRERRTAALTVGDHELSNAELNYFYVDAVNNFYQNYGSYASLFGLDVTLPLNEQVTDEETGATWADDFLDSAKANAQAVYALTDEAAKQGYALTEEDLSSIEEQIATLELYGVYYYGYSDLEDYLKAIYGSGASEESFRAYAELTTLAQSYQNHYTDSLTYDDAALRAAEAENYNEYSSFSYNSYYLNTSKFLTGGTTDEEGSTTYTDEEKEASVKAAQEAAEALAAGEYESVADFDAAIAELSINADTENAASTAYTDTAYSSVNAVVRDWVADESRKAGDMDCIPSTTTSTAEDGTETTTTNGYYVVYFVGSTDNDFPMANVRHILAAFEGGTTDENGTTTYSDEEKAAAKSEAEAILAEWKAGEATEESFAALANEKSDDGDGTTGGLYENINPASSYVTNFKNWALDDHKAGDTEIVETEYGYHVMYYAGDTELTYRDYQITNTLISEDTTEWYNALVEAMTVTELNTEYLSKDLVLSNG